MKKLISLLMVMVCATVFSLGCGDTKKADKKPAEPPAKVEPEKK